MTDTFNIDDRQMMAMEKEIDFLSDRAIPIAIQQTLSNTARTAWKHGRENTDREFQNRNTWTKRSQTYQRAEGLDVKRMVAVAGSHAGYLAQQEEGFSRTSRKSGVWVPTAEAAGQSGMKRTKPIRAKYRRSRIKLKRGKMVAPTSKAQANLFKIVNAVRGNGYFWGKLGSTIGMWQVDGNTNSGRIILTGVRLLYSANRRTVRTKPHKWHEPAVERANDRLGDEYYNALKRQLMRVRKKYKKG